MMTHIPVPPKKYIKRRSVSSREFISLYFSTHDDNKGWRNSTYKTYKTMREPWFGCWILLDVDSEYSWIHPDSRTRDIINILF